jgi:peroxiredoxin
VQTNGVADVHHHEIERKPMTTTIARTTESEMPAKALAAGEIAPDFTLNCTPDQCISLSELRGRPVILAFYPADWSPVCGDQMALYNELLSEFHRYEATLIGVSVDGVWCHDAFAAARHLHFPLVADFEPKGEVARRYGVYRSEGGTCERALFVIDRNGVIRWSYLSPVAVNPGADGILSALEALSPTQHKSRTDDDSDFCKSEGVICAPSSEAIEKAASAMEGRKS